MKSRIIFSKFINMLGLAALAFVAASEARASLLPFNEYAGLQFAAPGPNCFASATKISNVNSHFRGMDEPEFRLILENFCEPVVSPQIGDIGVFSVSGFAFIHAFVYVNKEMGIQKPGVDYMGPTPINYSAMSSIDYTYGASPECRRYSPDISECANHKSYVRCQPVTFSAIKALQVFNQKLLSIENLQDEILLGQMALNFVSLSGLEKDLYQYKNEFSSLPEDVRVSALGKLMSAKLVSLHKQNEFFRQRVEANTLGF